MTVDQLSRLVVVAVTDGAAGEMIHFKAGGFRFVATRSPFDGEIRGIRLADSPRLPDLVRALKAPELIIRDPTP